MYIMKTIRLIGKELYKVIGQQEFYWKRRVTDAIMIHQHNQQTINLDRGLNLSKLRTYMACISWQTDLNHYKFIFHFLTPPISIYLFH